jgi:transposase
MVKHRSPSVAFKRQVAGEFIAGETLHALSKRHDISRQLIRIWVGKFEAGALDDDVQAADLLQDYEAKIAALERMVGRQALEIEMLTVRSRNIVGTRWGMLLSCMATCLTV